ncbi:hypothetical protein EC973_005151 [Apophysomyces ossiformis]|uniref:Uncharacterized protein n=1 Tax=Apophysomyces ossiformis TaxID=679940 RepID=A0A8H7EPI2_9FUNG|nr:hypothetical protein EC973_005151 [Apophysomyces ossiformis]
MTLDICREVKELRQAVQELKTEIADLKRNVVSSAPVPAQSLLPGVDAPTNNDNRTIDQPLEEDRASSRYGKTKQLTAELIQWLVNKVKGDDDSIDMDTAKNLLKHANIIAKVAASFLAGKMDKPTAWARVPMEIRMTGYKYLEEKLVPAGIPMDRCIGYWCARLML